MVSCRPIRSCILSLLAEQNDLAYAVPGGLIGVGTKIDPQLCRADRLVGHVLGAVGTLPDIYVELEISFYLFRRLLGVRTEGDKKGAKVRILSIHIAQKSINVIVKKIASFIRLGHVEADQGACN